MSSGAQPGPPDTATPRTWWQRLRGTGNSQAPGRWVVVDVETSGLDAHRDRLLAIAGIALVAGGDAPPRIALGDSFEVVLRQAGESPVDKSNILLHGIGVGAQRAGTEPAEALAAFEQWVAGAPLLAFHSAFDETMISRAVRAVHGRAGPGPWVDLAHVAEVVRPDVKARSLDQWMAACGITCLARHQAAADTLATAELLQQLWPAVRAAGAGTGFKALQTLAAQRRWVTGR